MLSVELMNLAHLLDSTGQLRNVSQQAKEWSARIQDAIWKTTVWDAFFVVCLTSDTQQVVDNIFAYETNGESNLSLTFTYERKEIQFSLVTRIRRSLCNG